ncbi:MAG: sodium:proton antiporter [Alistipes sp.]|nr:sodium:proton antiporter [Alistipes sp.]
MQQIEIWALIPFALMLLSIAIMPLIATVWWEKNTNKLLVSAILAAPAIIYLIKHDLQEELKHQILFDYLPFIILLASLFIVTGGILLQGHIQARPRNNTILLTIGYLLASFIGTTGASMLLIHPLLYINRYRQNKTHTILFFIALVANCGGILSPLGDPPLFLLYLRGVEFTWFLNLLPEWTFVGVSLLLLYYFTDRRYYYKEEKTEMIMADFRERSTLSIKGGINIIYLLGIILSVLLLNSSYIPAMGKENAPIYLKYLREITLVFISILSLLTTRKKIRQENHFSWAPISEVAYIFVGIFITMTPALLFLSSNAQKLGISKPWQFFYSAGILSAFLDNSPTTVAFHTIAQNLSNDSGTIVAGVEDIILKAIAMGAVFFGAMTYIGNGPNFMVKAIAEQEGVKMPSFLGYIIKFSLKILLPIYIITQIIFLHK